MTAVTVSHPAAAQMVRGVVARPGIGIGAHILQQRELKFVRLHIDSPALILVTQGAKTIAAERGAPVQAQAGQAIALASGQTVDITNHVAANGRYEALWIIFDASLVTQFAALHPGLKIRRDAWPIRRVEPGFRAAFDRARAALADTDGVPPEIARHHLMEVLLWIGGHGGAFECTEAKSVAQRVRHLLAGAIDHPWTAPDIARQCAFSEATLRRRLADEGVTLSEVLTDARMSFALTLLQSTDRPIAEIALDVGYESASRFAVRFRKRFGFAPSSVRGHLRHDAVPQLAA